MNASACALLCALIAMQDALPDLPPAQPAPETPAALPATTETPSDGALPPARAPRRRINSEDTRTTAPAQEEARKRPRPRRRDSGDTGTTTPRRRRATKVDPAPGTRAPRRRITTEEGTHPDWVSVNTHTRPMGVRARAGVAAGQLMLGGVGALGIITASAGAGLLARTVDRPAGGLWRAPVPVGGLLPLTTALMGSSIVVPLGVVGLGYMAERRVAGPVAAMAAWLVVASVAATVGMTAVLVPAPESSRNFAIRENAMALTVVGLAVLGPAAAIGAYQAASLAQERLDAWMHARAVANAREAVMIDEEEKAEREKKAAERAAQKAAEEAARPLPPLEAPETPAPAESPATTEAPAAPPDMPAPTEPAPPPAAEVPTPATPAPAPGATP